MTVQTRVTGFVDEENGLLQQLWRRMNLSDGLYSLWFLGLTLALLFVSHSLEHWSRFLLLNVAILEVIALTAWKAPSGPGWRIAHDWYPILLFIVGFEEIARLSLAFVDGWKDAGLLRLEASLFHQPPTTWLAQFRHPLAAEVLEFGYLSFYWILPIIGLVLYAREWKKGPHLCEPFRLWMNSLAVGYVTCFSIYLLFPTEGPAHTLGHPEAIASGPFRWVVLLIQEYGGVHGNAFPSGHIMAAVVSLIAAIRWAPRLGAWLVLPLLLMCVGAVYDGYHYVSDIVAGAALGALSCGIVFLFADREHGVN